MLKVEVAMVSPVKGEVILIEGRVMVIGEAAVRIEAPVALAAPLIPLAVCHLLHHPNLE